MLVLLSSNRVITDWALIEEELRRPGGYSADAEGSVSLWSVAVCVVYILSSLSLDAQLCNMCFGQVSRLRQGINTENNCHWPTRAQV